jgi:lysophospholipase L1-like esterase
MRIGYALRLAFINIAVFIGLCLAVLFLASLIGDGYNYAKSFFPKHDKRAELPAYEDHEKARQIYRDQKNSDAAYVPFVEWRQKPYASANLNIDAEGNRQHSLGQDNDPGARTLGFYGGSSVWGTGVDDDGTLPAQFDSITKGYVVTNYGERGHTSLQNVIQLLTQLNRNRAPQVAIFLEGFNDVWTHCNAAVTRRLNGHMEERNIESALARSAKRDYLYNNIVVPIVMLLSEVAGGDKDLQIPICSTGEARADQVAETLVRNMEIGHALVTADGGEFYAFLQPTAFTGHPRTDYLDLDDENQRVLRTQFEAVYQRVRAKIAQRSLLWFFDLTGALDGTDALLVDHVHVTDKGNKKLAEAIAVKIGALK